MSGGVSLLLVQTSKSAYCAPQFETVRVCNRAQLVAIAPSVLMELRKVIRYQLDAPALFSWVGVQHKRLKGEGVTRDISVLGAFILTPTCPPVAAPVQVEVLLRSTTGLKSVFRIEGEARVVRIDHPSGSHGGNGFAVVRKDQDHWSLTKSQQDDSEACPAAELSMAGKTNCD
jgi:hypothetical protein